MPVLTCTFNQISHAPCHTQSSWRISPLKPSDVTVLESSDPWCSRQVEESCDMFLQPLKVQTKEQLEAKCIMRI